MSTHALRLVRDALPGRASLSLPATNRVLYVLEGDVVVDGRRVAAGEAWHGAGACAGHANAEGATVLRYELRRGDSTAGSDGTTVLDHPIDLDPGQAYLMRADRVDFALGGVALPHGHRGGGIRCLIAGGLEVTVGAGSSHLFRPGQAWFESGREPVLAKASADTPTSFIRVSILPREIRGKSSIVYVDPEDARRAPPRKYTVFVDEPIEV